MEEKLSEKKRRKYKKLAKRYVEVAEKEAAAPGSMTRELSLLHFAMAEFPTGADPDD